MDLMALYERLCAFADDHAVFERERQRALAEAFDQTPDDKRSLWLQVQSDIEAVRARMTPERFRVELFQRMGENVENMGDLFGAIRVKLDDFHPERPRLREVQAAEAH
jgi:hypothetical protein